MGTTSLLETFQPEGVAAAEAWTGELLTLLLPGPIERRPPATVHVGAASFWFAGFVTVSDWVGSTQRFFPYLSPTISPVDYWAHAQNRARDAVSSLGLAASSVAPIRSFSALTGRQKPSPLQTCVAEVPLGPGPTLVIIEDVTGAGKTEAAQVLVNRLLAGDANGGVYWAMPTQATANAMYERQRLMLSRLFTEDAAPQLVLAHGATRIHPGFQASILRSAATREESLGDSEADETASAACSAFLADDARLSLLADVGAGTIDQALLGVLPARFQAVRLFGLADKVLVVDEAHAYDAYMSEELRGLLNFHAALGGSAIVLSATLPQDVRHKAGRAQLVQSWLEGCGVRHHGVPRPQLTSKADYPLVTVVRGTGPAVEYPVQAASWTRRYVPVRCVSTDDAVVESLVRAATLGGAVAWVRNTVDDALRAADQVRARGLDPIVFHARFAQVDRQRIEKAVMARLGPNAPADDRQAVVVIATQVIEQSLDLDFDWMASDLAPIDLLVQRAGRLRRHPARDPLRPQVPFELLLRAPEWTDTPEADWLSATLSGTSYVYPDPALQWRTMGVLRERGGIRTPEDLRHLIESVYGDGAVVPPGLDVPSLRAEGVSLAQGGRARQTLLSVRDGYRGEQVAWVGEDRPEVATRLGTPQTILRLARLNGTNAPEPWATGDLPEWALWALSDVKVSARRVPPGSSATAQDADIARSARDTWGLRERERSDMVLVLLRRDGNEWHGQLANPRGRPIQIRYSVTEGLR